MKRSELASQIKEMIVGVLQEVSQDDVAAAQAYNAELEKTKALSSDLGLTEEDEVEPTSNDIKKNDSISTISRKLQDTNNQFRFQACDWLRI